MDGLTRMNEENFKGKQTSTMLPKMLPILLRFGVMVQIVSHTRTPFFFLSSATNYHHTRVDGQYKNEGHLKGKHTSTMLSALPRLGVRVLPASLARHYNPRPQITTTTHEWTAYYSTGMNEGHLQGQRPP